MIYEGALVFLLTVLFGPVSFYILGRHTTENLPLFPLALIDGLGDTVFLPLFNAIAVYNGVLSASTTAIITAYSITILITCIMTYFIVFHQEGDEWSRPKKGQTNIGTWYHAGFTFFQSGFILLGLHSAYSPLLLLPLGGYVVTLIHSMLYSKHV